MSAHAGMNRFFRLVWSDTLCAWVAVAENARGKGKRSTRAARRTTLQALAAALSLGALALPAHAGPGAAAPAATQLPTGGVVSAGRATINGSVKPDAAVLNIDQSTQRATINWDTFNLGAAAELHFNQPNSSASTLNRVLDSNPSQILGKITAPGQVVLSNPNGVMFGKSASVEVGGLTATTHTITDADFMAGKSSYARNGATGKVVNEGELRAALNGYIALLAPEVRNEGVIVARLGTVALAAGEAITLNFSGNHLAGITVQPSAIKALVENKGAVLAPGGLIVLSARALDRLQGGVVKNSGQLEATGLAMKGGRIVLEASDRIENTGRISANAGNDGSGAAGPAGSVTLTAPEIVNSGSITATGTVPAAQARTVAAATMAGGSIVLNAGTITQKAGGVLDVSGASGGSLKLRAALNLILDGTLSAVGTQGAGGEVRLAAGRDLTLSNAVVDASGDARGGRIHAEAGRADTPAEPDAPALPALPTPLDAPDHHPTAALLGSTQLRSSSRRGPGGSVALTGENVDLLDHTAIDARGATGGGEVLVGGGWQGGGTLRQATQVTQAETSVIDVSATARGNGGTLVLWSDIHDAASQTHAHGSLRADGAAGGDGGRIETSGHWLDVEGARAQAAAGRAADSRPAGQAGQWLLDPYDVAISTSANSNVSGFSATGSPSNIQASTINTALNGGTNVTVTTGTSGTTERGDINVNAAIDKSSGATDVTLTLRAANSIVVNNSISHTGGTGKLNIVLDADNDAGTRDGAGVVILNSNLATGGGSLQFGTGATLAINSITTKVGGDVYVGGASAQTITTSGGAVTINGEMLLANPNGLTITTSGGNVTFGGLLNAGDSYTNVTSSGISWASAYAAAKGATAGGSAVGDTYLATITSRLENAVASRAASYTSSWLGARRGNTPATATTTATADDYWRWVTGPEGGQEGGNGLRFWLGALAPGAAVNGGYANWNGGEPNNSPASGGTNESAIQFTGAFGRWNDADPALAGGGLGVNTYLRELNLAASPLTVSAGAGTVTFTAMVGGLKSLASLNVTAATIAINGGGVTTEGLQTYNGAVTLGSAATVLTQTNANTDFTLGANRSITNATGANATLTIKTTGGIVMAAGSSITSSTGTLTPVLNADSDASNGGYIWLQQAAGTGATINSNGGAITLSGGADVTTGYAEGRTGIIGNGVTLDSATLNSGGGNVVIRGKSATTGTVYSSSESSTQNNTDGVRLHGSNLVNAGSGTVNIQGVARGTDAASSNGIETNANGYTRILSSATGTTAISLSGDASAGTAANGWGTFLWGTNSAGIVLAATGSNGGVTLNGVGRNTTTGGGTHLEPNAYVLAASGPISLTGTKGSASTYEDVVINGTVGFAASLAAGFGVASPVTASSSAITIAADSLSANRVFGSGSFTGSAVQSSGTLTLTPRTAGRALAVQTADPGASIAWIKPASMFGASGLFKTGFNKVVFGSATTGNVTLDNYSFDNDTDLNTGASAVLGAVGIATKTLTVNVTGSGSITDTGNVAVSKLALLGSSSAVTLDSAGNAIGTVAANVASLSLANSAALTVGTVGATNGLTATGTIDVATLAGDLTLAQGVVTTNTGASAVRLNAGKSTAAGTSGGGDIVLSGSPAITVGSGGRATLFTGSVSGSTGVTAKLGAASGRFRYNSDETSTNYSTALGSGLYAIYREQPLLTVTANAASRSYDGTAYSGGNGATGPSGYVNGDTSAILTGALTYGGSAQGAVNAGSYTITPGGYGNGLGYGFSYVGGTLTVNPRAVTFSGTRVYDAGTAIAGSALSVSNLVGSDVVGATGSGTLSGKAAGTRTISVFGSLALTGAAAANYTLSGASGSVTITPATLGVGGVTAAGRTYDATTAATLLGTATVTPLGTDVVSVSGTPSASFANKNVGTAKPVTVSGYTLTGADAANYSIVQPTGLTATITPANAAVSGVTAVNRVYDTTTGATLAGTAAVTPLGSDVLGVAGTPSASFADKNAGTAKPVTVGGYTLTGADAANYAIVQPAGLTANITPATAAVSGVSAVGRVYDATTVATLAGTAMFTPLGGDVVSVSGTPSASFANKNAGANKPVTVSGYTLTGTDAANYSIVQPTGLTATITPASTTVTGVTAADRVYDTTTGATLVGTASVAHLGSDVLSLAGTATASFANKNTGTAKPVTVSGYTLAGADAANYSIVQPTGLTANITPAAATVSGVTAADRVYDTTTGATLVGTATITPLGSDALSLAGTGTASFADKNAGTAKPVTVSGYTLAGTDAANYSIVQPTGLTASIAPASATVSGVTAVDRTYDASTTATLAGTAVITPLGGDVLSLAGAPTASFANKNAGTAKPVTVSGYTLAGADAANYSIVQPTGLSATITPASASITGVTAANRGYDGTTAIALTGSPTVAHLGSDVLSVAGSGVASVADKNTGSGKTVSVSGFTLAGADAGNYSVLQPSGLTTTITPAPITLSTGNVTKSYDGGTGAAGTASVAGGTLFGGDTLSGGSFAFSDKNVGSGNKTVTVSGVTVADGNGGANYAVSYAANTTSTITPAALTVTAPTASKTYDGNTNADGTASVGSLAGAAAGEIVGTAARLAFTDKNAGSGKTVRASGLAVRDSGGNDVTANYAIAYVDNTSGSIAQAPLTVSANADARFVSQSDAAGFNGASYSGLVGGETAAVLGGTLTITRPAAGSDVAAGTYAGALVPSGLSSGNYAISYATGSYTILPANRLLVRVGNTSATYGSDPSFNVVSAEYLEADNTTIHALTGSGSGNSYTFSDGAGGSVSFTLGVLGNVVSTAGKTAVGNYAVGDNAANIVGNNFTTLSFVGNLAVTQKAVTASASGVGKVYDGTTSMTGFTLDLAGKLAGDALTASGSGAFSQKQAGTNIGYSVTGVTLGGTDGGNYYLNGGNAFTGNDGTITARPVAVSGVSATGKTYDATLTAPLTGTAAVARIGSDDITLAGTGVGSFADKNAGTGKAVTVTGYSLSGADAANYSIVQPAGLTADIAAANLAVTGVSANGKTYDATRTATLAGTATITSLSGDAVNLIGTATATFADKNAGVGKAVTVTGYSLTGADAANYNIVQPTGLTADISAANLAVTGVSAVGKTYDATRNATLTGTAGIARLGSDDVTLAGSAAASFADKNAGVGKAVTVTGYSLTGADASNYSLVQPAGLTADIAAANLAVTGVSAVGKTYDATRNATLTGTASIAQLGSDDVNLIGTASASFSDKNAGVGKAVTVTGYSLTGADAANYSIVQPTGLTADIAAANLAVTGVSAVGKTYDATRSATLTGTAAITRFGSDDVNLTGIASASFADKNAAIGKAVTVTGYSLTGADASNYSIVQPTGLTADIAAANLAVTGVSAAGKTYDATRNATLTGTAAIARLGSDDVTLAGTAAASFADKNAGAGKAVSVTGYSLTGADAANYNIVQPTGLTSDIAAANLAVTGVSAAGKTYDATRNATLTGTAAIARLGSDDVTLAGTAAASFADKNAGTGKTVTVTGLSLAGADASNYNIVQPTGLSADIAPATLALTGLSAVGKTYDATRNATLVGTASVTGLAGDDVALAGSGSASFADKNAGSGKAVSVGGYTLRGADAANYRLSMPAGLSADIAPAPLAVTGLAAADKVYDGSAAAALTGSAVVTPFGSDAVTLAGAATASFGGKNVGAGQAVGVAGFSLAGADAGNYTLLQPAGLSANITPRTLNLVYGGVDKVYDGSTAAAVTVSDDRVAGDALLVTPHAAFADKNAGSAKAVTISAITLAGADAANYSVVAGGGSTTASITPRTLVVGYTGVGKVYDGSRDAAVTTSDDRIGGDDLRIVRSASFADKNAGSEKAITIDGVSLAGGDAGNYRLDANGGTASASIAPRSVSVGFSHVDKVYDGTADAVLGAGTPTFDGIVAGDKLSASAAFARYDDKNAGSGKTVTIGGLSLAGSDAHNYVLTSDGSTGTGNIAQATLVVTANAAGKVYDGTTAASATLADNRAAGDALTLSYAGAAFADKNAGTGKTVTVSGIHVSGADAGNYRIAAGDTTASADIGKATLLVTASGADKVYDAGTGAHVTLSDNRIGPDELTLAYAGASFADKNAGSGKIVSVSGITVGGADAGNYSVAGSATTTADVAKATLTVSATGIPKVYDASTSVGVTLSDNRLGHDELTLGYASSAMADKNVGSGKAVQVGGITLGGADAANYSFNTAATTTVDVAKAPLTVSATGLDSVYDATTVAHVRLADNRLAGDVLSLSYAAATLADKNAGSAKPVSVSGISLTGPDAGNYSFNSSAATTADVAKAPLVVTATTLPHTYDGSTAAQVSLADNRVAGDVLSLGYGTASFADKNAGSGKAVSIGGIALSGPDAGNYSVAATATSTGSIAPATLVVGAVTQPKPFDGSTQAVVTLTDNRVAGDDLVIAHGAAAFADTAIGSGKTVTVGGLRIAGGADQGNYVLAGSSLTTTGTIEKAPERVDTAALQPKAPAMTLPLLDLNLPVGATSAAAAGLSLPSTPAAATATATTTTGASMTAATPALGSATAAAPTTAATARTDAAGTGGVSAGVASLPVKLPSDNGPARIAAPAAPADAGGAPSPASSESISANGDRLAAAGGSSSSNAAALPVRFLDTLPAEALGNITVSLVRAATPQQTGVVSVSVPASIVSKGNDYSFPLPSNVSEAVGTREVRVTLTNGDRLPPWLRYVPGTLSFAVTAAPPGALPVQVIVRSGRQRWSVVVTERAGA